MNLNRLDRLYATLTVTGTDRDGDPQPLLGVDVAILARRATPNEDTVWTATDYADGAATLLLAGPDADATDALAVPEGGGDLWLRVDDDPEVITAMVERINVQ